MSIRILLIDPHSIIRLGIVQTLIAADDFEVVADVESLDEGISRAKQTTPDVLVIDADLSSPSVFNRLAQLHSAMPELRTLLFTANDHAKIADHVIQCGATGYLIKAAGPEELALAIRSIHQGRLFISHSRSSVAPKSSRTKSSPSLPDGAPRRRNDGLSTREREVLQRLADGMTNKQVAAELFLSVKTVETYRARIMKKFALVDRVGLVQFARQTIQA